MPMQDRECVPLDIVEADVIGGWKCPPGSRFEVWPLPDGKIIILVRLPIAEETS